MSGVPPATSDQDFCLALMNAESESDVVALLKAHGYWDDPSLWRYIGDNESNWSTIGNQQSDPIAALAEKFVNSIDSRLTNACLTTGIDPKGPDAPATMREAVAQFFEGATNPAADHVGRMADWTDPQITEQAKQLTLSATGPRGRKPNLVIADLGEGQTPDQVPNTFMSLDKRNKVDIHFVQGKFNMGGTGALYSCGTEKIQLLVTRRNPALLDEDASERDAEWSVTVTRLEATGGRNPVFTYLAPIGATGERDGKVLSFSAPSMPIMPAATKEERGACVREVDHGAFIKLFEYDINQTTEIIRSRQGLRQKLETRLPELALPIGVYECRDFKGDEAGSFFTRALGTATRVEQEKHEDRLEFAPLGGILNLNGFEIVIKVYAFKRKPGQKRRTGFLADYVQGGGVLYVVNGQTHAQAGNEFFRRKKVDLDYLRNDLLVIVDCSPVDEVTRADLFMNSRDRNRLTASWKLLEGLVERFLRQNEILKELAIRRREAIIRERTEDNQALADLLGRVLQASPDLAKVLLGGVRLPSPFPKAGTGSKGRASDFEGKEFPTFFHFEKHQAGEERKRTAEAGRELRIQFTTDVRDDYFWRQSNRGGMGVRLTRGDLTTEVAGVSLMLRSGTAKWTTDLPEEARPGDLLIYDFEVTDPFREEPFHNRIRVEVVPHHERRGGGGGTRSRSNTGDGKNDADAGLALPEVQPVHEGDAEWDEFDFDSDSALAIRRQPGHAVSVAYDFFYNVDNSSLLRAQKANPDDAELTKERFRCALVLVGLALIQQVEVANKQAKDAATPKLDLEDLVPITTRALARVLLPLVEFVGALSAETA